MHNALRLASRSLPRFAASVPRTHILPVYARGIADIAGQGKLPNIDVRALDTLVQILLTILVSSCVLDPVLALPSHSRASLSFQKPPLPVLCPRPRRSSSGRALYVYGTVLVS